MPPTLLGAVPDDDEGADKSEKEGAMPLPR